MSRENKRLIEYEKKKAPGWFNVGKSTPKTHLENVFRGRHPLGFKLNDQDKRCGDCDHLRIRKRSKKYYKCDLIDDTRGPATDVRKKWRACENFEGFCSTNCDHEDCERERIARNIRQV